MTWTTAKKLRAREHSKAHYHRNKERVKAQARRFTKSQTVVLRAIIEEAKRQPCIDCVAAGIPGDMPAYMKDFDHLDASRKRFNVSDAMAHGYSVETLRAEIAKCEVVCANHHRERTHKRRETAKGQPKCEQKEGDTATPQLDLLGRLG